MMTSLLKNAVSTVLPAKSTVPKIAKFSVIDFVMELRLFNSKINDWLDQHHTHLLGLDDFTLSLEYDMGLSKAECRDVLRRLQNKHNITFTDPELARICVGGCRLARLYNASRKAAWSNLK